MENNNKFPYEIVKLDEKTNAKLTKDFSNGIPYFVQVGPEKWLMPNKYENYYQWYYNFKLRPDDVFITGYPRSGNTLTNTLVWLLLNNVDLEGFENKSFSVSVPFLEHKMVVSDQALAVLEEAREPKLQEMCANLKAHEKLIDDNPGRRIIKTHLPLKLLPGNLVKTCKVIYIFRQPKDVIVSYYHLQRLVGGRSYNGTFENYYGNFEKNLSFFAPYFDHVKLGWNVRNEKNVCFITYKDLTQDLRGSIVNLARFLDVKLTEQQLDKLHEYLKFDNFKNSSVANTAKAFKNAGFWNKDEDSDFVRKGKSGGWTDYFTGELNTKADEWIAKEVQRTGINDLFSSTSHS